MNIPQVMKKICYQTGAALLKPTVVAILALAISSMPSSVVPGMAVAYAQNTNATIRGQVLDPAGALVPDAKVVILNKNTGVIVFNGKSDSAGAFVAPQVLPGTYKVTVDSPGLKEAVVDDLVATVAQVASVNINMQIGGTSDVITVEAKGEQLDRSTSDV